jgi:hypothetical protein
VSCGVLVILHKCLTGMLQLMISVTQSECNSLTWCVICNGNKLNVFKVCINSIFRYVCILAECQNNLIILFICLCMWNNFRNDEWIFIKLLKFVSTFQFSIKADKYNKHIPLGCTCIFEHISRINIKKLHSLFALKCMWMKECFKQKF